VNVGIADEKTFSSSLQWPDLFLLQVFAHARVRSCFFMTRFRIEGGVSLWRESFQYQEFL